MIFSVITTYITLDRSGVVGGDFGFSVTKLKKGTHRTVLAIGGCVFRLSDGVSDRRGGFKVV